MSFDFDVKSIVVNLIVSAIGFIYFTYGKKMAIFSFMLCGMALMVYPYFVSSLGWMIGIGVVLAAFPFVKR